MADTSALQMFPWSLVPSYVQSFGLALGAGWAYWKFVHQRTNEPATDIDVDLRFVGIQHGQRIVEITSILKNQSLVRVEYKDFEVSIRYLIPTDSIIDGDAKIYYQLKFSRQIDDRISGVTRCFANVHYLNPRQEFKHRYITFVPEEATFVRVHCKLSYSKTGVVMDSQRVFAFPGQECDHTAEAA